MKQTKVEQANQLGVAPVGKLIFKYAAPCVASLVINGLYNIVDQIFIGNGVGYLGNSATNVVFPLTVLCVALGVLFGDGAATYLSLSLGKGEKENAKKGAVNGILLSIIASIVLLVLSASLLKPIVYLFGCTSAAEPYAIAYGGIVVFGFPFVLISTTLNSIIRADGSPKFAMLSLASGAVLNTILDPIFIFVFHMGVTGAAIATVIGQVVAFAISCVYLWKWKSFKIEKKDWRFDGKTCFSLLPLGISSFVNQMATVVMTAVLNNLLTQYGASSIYGSDIPLAVMGITLKINQIFLFIVVGIATGAQPIISFNRGKGDYHRVMKAFWICVASSLVVALIAFAVFQFAPMSIVSLFGSEEGLYDEFAVKSLRIFLLLIVLDAFQTTASIFAQSIKKPVQAMIMSLSRQIVFLVPLAIIFPIFFGIEGILWAGPAADALAFVLSVILSWSEIVSLRKELIKQPAKSLSVK